MRLHDVAEGRSVGCKCHRCRPRTKEELRRMVGARDAEIERRRGVAPEVHVPPAEGAP